MLVVFPLPFFPDSNLILISIPNTKLATSHQTNYAMKPFLKWVGGKTQIIDQVLAEFPREIDNYYEPFLGGGSVLLALLSEVKAGRIKINQKIYASDLNQSLIATYKNIQANPQQIITLTQHLVEQYQRCTGTTVNRKPTTIEEATTSQESYYYWIRQHFNTIQDKTTLQASAMFLFLNKTCFRGIFRESGNGFNVPFGNYKNPAIVDPQQIQEISELIRPVIFRNVGFPDSLQPQLSPNDFIYFDPPYAPESATSFVSYTNDGFSMDDHSSLFAMCDALNEHCIKFLMSNADVEMVRDAFPNPTYNTKTISCRRAINSKNPEARTNELLIKNYAS